MAKTHRAIQRNPGRYRPMIAVGTLEQIKSLDPREWDRMTRKEYEAMVPVWAETGGQPQTLDWDTVK